jgi:hypothetical protein
MLVLIDARAQRPCPCSLSYRDAEQPLLHLRGWHGQPHRLPVVVDRAAADHHERPGTGPHGPVETRQKLPPRSRQSPNRPYNAPRYRPVRARRYSSIPTWRPAPPSPSTSTATPPASPASTPHPTRSARRTRSVSPARSSTRTAPPGSRSTTRAPPSTSGPAAPPPTTSSPAWEPTGTATSSAWRSPNRTAPGPSPSTARPETTTSEAPGSPTTSTSAEPRPMNHRRPTGPTRAFRDHCSSKGARPIDAWGRRPENRSGRQSQVISRTVPDAGTRTGTRHFHGVACATHSGCRRSPFRCPAHPSPSMRHT